VIERSALPFVVSHRVKDITMTERDPAQTRTDLGRNLTYGLLDALGRAIVTGYYDKRVFPTEAELAKQHAVSRSVTREAVKMLTAKGLLSARPRQGTIIQPTASWNLFDPDVLHWLLERKFSLDLLRHFNQLRVAIEPEAAALAASHANAAQLEAIGAGLARMEAAEKGHDNTLDADIAFHIAVLQASNNPFFLQFHDLVRTALRTSIQFTNRIKGHSASVADHAAVRNAIVRHHADGARVAMRRIIGDVLELIVRAETAKQKGTR
jgi:DNA-binding FadR family transcriptional regulator